MIKGKKVYISIGLTILAVLSFHIFFAISIIIMPSPAYAAVPQPQFLLRYEGNFTDSSTNGNNGINSGGVITRDPVRGNVLYLNGSGSDVNIKTPLGSSFTKAAWVFAPTGTVMNLRNIISNGQFGGQYSNYMWVHSSKLRVGQFVSGYNVEFASGPANFPLGQWVHVAETFDITNNKYMVYQNGVLVGSGIASQPPASSTGTTIGSYGNLSATHRYGYMDDTQMWNSVLTGSDILAVYSGDLGISKVPDAPFNLATYQGASSGSVDLVWSGVSGIPTVTDYLIEYKTVRGSSTWNVFEDGVGTGTTATVTGLINNLDYNFRVSAINSLGTGPASSIVNLSYVTAEVPEPVFLLRFQDNYLDNSLYAHTGINNGVVIVNDPTRGLVGRFNGSSSHVNISVPLGSSFTKAAWVFAPTGTVMSARNIISNGPYGGNFSSYLWVDGGVQKAGHFRTGEVNVAYATGTTSFPVGQWVHVALTFDSSTNKYTIYQNSVIIGSGIATQPPASSTGTTIGSFSLAGNNRSGYIDNAEMWDLALTPNEIKSLYGTGGGYGGDLGVDYATLPWSAFRNFHIIGVSTGAVQVGWSDMSKLSFEDPDVIDYQVEYKIASGSTWNVFADGVGTGTTATVTGLINGLAYDFRASAIHSTGVGMPSPVLRAMPAPSSTYMFILSNGQSLSVGALATPALSVTQPYMNLSLTGGVLGPQGTTGPLVPLIEVGVETPSAGMANSLTAYPNALSRPVIVGLHGASTQPYATLKKGTAPYATGMMQAALAKSYVEASGAIFLPIGVTIVHGEQDAYLGNSLQYASYLAERQHDYETDINALMGTSGKVLPMFINQMNTNRTGQVAVQQYNAHKNYTGKIILVGPKYQYAYNTDHLHLTNIQSKHMGEMFAKVMNKVVLNNETWNPLMPKSVSRIGKVITVSYNIPVGTLVLDTGNVAQRANYGFEFSQSGGSTTQISGVSLVKGNTEVQIVLSGAADGTNQVLRYAYSCGFISAGYGVCGGANSSAYVGGNLRDSDTSVASGADSTGLPLYNRGVTFEEPITLITKPGAPTSVFATGGDGSAVVSFLPPANTGGTGITEYIVTSNPGGIVATGTGSPITVLGLTNQVSYTFTVVAKNIEGTGESSIPSNTVWRWVNRGNGSSRGWPTTGTDTRVRDICPNGDASPSNFDNTCLGVYIPLPTTSILSVFLNKCDDEKGEEMQAYCFSRLVGSTTMPTFEKARFNDLMTRGQLAKIITNFTINILGKIPDTNKICVAAEQDLDGLTSFMVQACQLGLMNTARPNDIVTRGEYITVLSRMIYGDLYNQKETESSLHPFYEHHIEKMYADGLIKIKNPLSPAYRYVPFLTLYRLSQKISLQVK